MLIVWKYVRKTYCNSFYHHHHQHYHRHHYLVTVIYHAIHSCWPLSISSQHFKTLFPRVVLNYYRVSVWELCITWNTINVWVCVSVCVCVYIYIVTTIRCYLWSREHKHWFCFIYKTAVDPPYDHHYGYHSRAKLFFICDSTYFVYGNEMDKIEKKKKSR